MDAQRILNDQLKITSKEQSWDCLWILFQIPYLFYYDKTTLSISYSIFLKDCFCELKLAKTPF